jgi:hypothetical protein
MVNTKIWLYAAAAFCATSLFLLEGCNSQEKAPAGNTDTSRKGTGQPAYALPDAGNAPLAGNDQISTFLYAPKPNEKFSYRVQQVNKIERDSLKLEQTIIESYTKTIQSVKPDGSVEMTVRIDSMRLIEKGPDPANPGKQITMQYNSRDTAQAARPEFKQYKGIVGADVRVIVNNHGKIEEISGITPILNTMLGDKKDSVPPVMREKLLQQLKEQFFQLPLQQEYQTYPDNGRVDSNRTWSRTDVLPLAGMLAVKNTVKYTMGPLRQMNGRRVARVDAVLTASVDKPNLPQDKVKLTLNSTKIGGKGESLVDAETGITLYKKNEVFTMLDATLMEVETKRTQRTVQSIQTTVTVELLK